MTSIGNRTAPLFFVVDGDNPNYRLVRRWDGSHFVVEYWNADKQMENPSTIPGVYRNDYLIDNIVEWSQGGLTITYFQPKPTPSSIVDASLT